MYSQAVTENRSVADLKAKQMCWNVEGAQRLANCDSAGDEWALENPVLISQWMNSGSLLLSH